MTGEDLAESMSAVEAAAEYVEDREEEASERARKIV
jgi:hypothetical protein